MQNSYYENIALESNIAMEGIVDKAKEIGGKIKNTGANFGARVKRLIEKFRQFRIRMWQAIKNLFTNFKKHEYYEIDQKVFGDLMSLYKKVAATKGGFINSAKVIAYGTYIQKRNDNVSDDTYTKAVTASNKLAEDFEGKLNAFLTAEKNISAYALSIGRDKKGKTIKVKTSYIAGLQKDCDDELAEIQKYEDSLNGILKSAESMPGILTGAGAQCVNASLRMMALATRKVNLMVKILNTFKARNVPH